MNPIETKLVDFLKQECMGEENAVYGKYLAMYFDTTTRKLRRLKAHLVLKHGIEIGSTREGYFYAKGDVENKRIEAEYISRARECEIMARAYKRIRKNRNQRKLV